jgi:hypothetical protein
MLSQTVELLAELDDGLLKLPTFFSLCRAELGNRSLQISVGGFSLF